MEIIGFIFICGLAVFIIGGSIIMLMLMNAFGNSDKCEIFIPLIIFIVGIALAYYGLSHSPFSIIINES